mgnify:FL=1
MWSDEEQGKKTERPTNRWKHWHWTDDDDDDPDHHDDHDDDDPPPPNFIHKKKLKKLEIKIEKRMNKKKI